MSIASKLTELAALRDDLVTNLEAKGIDTTGKRTFSALVPEVANIKSVVTILEGECGANVRYELKSDGTMWIVGTGACANYNRYTKPFVSAEKLIKKVVVDEGVTTVGESMFGDCVWLEEVEIANTVTTVNAGAFSGCTALESVDFGTGLTTIGASAFYGCSSLEGVSFPNGLTTIGGSCFSGAGIGGALVIPNSVTSIANQAFDWCVNLTSASFGTGLTSIGWYVMRNCTGLTVVNVPSSVTSIDANAFNSCTQQGLVINVDKEQDSISGAPWGATNATVVWATS